MKFRPCIDIHNGKVKQIVGGSLKDQGDQAAENFVSEQDAAFYAELYKKAGLKGGHVILLNGKDSPNYEATKAQALLALKRYPRGLQIGGGICPENASEYLEAGASHVIVTSYVFKNGVISWENLEEIRDAAGKEHLVLDLSCRKKDGKYYIVTDRWQKFTEEIVTSELMERLGSFCDEFLVHAVDVEGKARGVETELAKLLGQYDDLFHRERAIDLGDGQCGFALAVAQRHQRGDGLPCPLCGGGVRSSARHVFQVDAGGKAFGDLIFQFQHDALGQLGADAGRSLEGFVVARRDGQRHTVGFHDAQDGKPHLRAHARHRGEQLETGLLLLAGKAVEADVVLGDVHHRIDGGFVSHAGQRTGHAGRTLGVVPRAAAADNKQTLAGV